MKVKGARYDPQNQTSKGNPTMIARFARTHVRFLASAAVVLTVAGVFIARTAFAKITFNTIDPVAIIADHGRRIVLSGPLSTTVVEKTELRVTITQRSTGAVAEGQAVFTSTGELQHWEIQTTTLGNAAFEEGPATAVALARTSSPGQATDAHQWLVPVTLGKQ